MCPFSIIRDVKLEIVSIAISWRRQFMVSPFYSSCPQFGTPSWPVPECILLRDTWPQKGKMPASVLFPTSTRGAGRQWLCVTWVAQSVAMLKSWRFSGKVDLLMLAVIHTHVGKWKKKKESGLSAVLPWRLTAVNPDSPCHENEPISGTRCLHTQPTKTGRAALHARKTGPGRLGCPLTRPRGCRFQRWRLESLMTST